MVVAPGASGAGGGAENLLEVRSGEKLHVFDALTGKWATADVGAK
jgi:hypothetical protein